MKTDIQNFLTQLIEAQHQMLNVLKKQQAVLVKPAKEAMEAITSEEKEALSNMQAVLDRREEILTSARLQNIRGDSIGHLCSQFFPHDVEMQKMINDIKHRAYQIQLLAFTNWTINRKSLIHVSQILELLETRGQGKTTYQPPANAGTARSNSVDRVA